MALIKYTTGTETTANAYIDQAYMTAYLADRISDTATAAYTASLEKDQLIMLATKRLDMFNFSGVRSTTTQSLKFPRYGIVIDDVSINSTTIPSAIEAATAEMVLFLVTNDITETNTDINYRSAKVGSIEVEYKDNQSTNTANVSLNAVIKGLLQPFMSNAMRVMKG